MPSLARCGRATSATRLAPAAALRRDMSRCRGRRWRTRRRRGAPRRRRAPFVGSPATAQWLEPWSVERFPPVTSGGLERRTATVPNWASTGLLVLAGIAAITALYPPTCEHRKWHG